MMDQQLLQLPGGDWIDPEMVAMVVGLRAVNDEPSQSSRGKGSRDDKVIIALRNGMVINEFVGPNQRVVDLRDQIATEINAAVYPFSVQ